MTRTRRIDLRGKSPRFAWGTLHQRYSLVQPETSSSSSTTISTSRLRSAAAKSARLRRAISAISCARLDLVSWSHCLGSEAATVPGLVVGGRLGEYRYYDMDQSVGKALEVAANLE